jgi:hypothetical protein
MGSALRCTDVSQIPVIGEHSVIRGLRLSSGTGDGLIRKVEILAQDHFAVGSLPHIRLRVMAEYVVRRQGTREQRCQANAYPGFPHFGQAGGTFPSPAALHSSFSGSQGFYRQKLIAIKGKRIPCQVEVSIQNQSHSAKPISSRTGTIFECISSPPAQMYCSDDGNAFSR